MTIRQIGPLGIVIVLIGCGTQALVEGFRPIRQLPLNAQIMFTGDRDRFRVFGINPVGDEHELRLTTSHGVVWITADGRVLRTTDFTPAPDPLFPVCDIRLGAATHYAGFAPNKDVVVFFGEDGRETARQACRQCWSLVAADVSEDDRGLLIAHPIGGQAALLFDARGSSRGSIRTTGYFTDMAAGRIGDGSADALFFYSAPDPELERGVHILGADGVERAKWRIAAGAGIAAATTVDGTPSVVSLHEDTLIDWDPLTGRELSRTVLDKSSAFRTIHTKRWNDGSRIVVLSGAGSLNKHMVAVIDAGGKVVFQEINDGRSYALALSSATANAFYVGIEGQVRRYSLR